MSSLDTIIIIPLIIIIIVFAFSLFSYAAQINLDEMNYSRFFLLNVLEPASINDKAPIRTLSIINRNWFFATSSYFANESTMDNTVILPNMVRQFENKGVWHILRYNRTFLALAKENSDLFLKVGIDEE